MLLDDGWPACAEWLDPSKPEASGCANPAPRHDNGDVPVDERKFPPSGPGANDGIKVVADYLHAKGLKMGIYTAPHGRTCGGYWGMLGHEATDAKMYANWGIVSGQQHPLARRPPSLTVVRRWRQDFLKLDMGCREDASIHDGTVKASLERVRDGLNKTGRPVLCTRRRSALSSLWMRLQPSR